MVKSLVKKLLPVMISSWLLFVITNLGVTVLTSQSITIRPLINTVVFALILYAWSFLNFVRKRRFAVGLMEFVIVIYTFGFISSIITIVANMHMINGLLILAMIGSFIGIVVNLFWFRACRHLNQRVVDTAN